MHCLQRIKQVSWYIRKDGIKTRGKWSGAGVKFRGSREAENPAFLKVNILIPMIIQADQQDLVMMLGAGRKVLQRRKEMCPFYAMGS